MAFLGGSSARRGRGGAVQRPERGRSRAGRDGRGIASGRGPFAELPEAQASGSVQHGGRAPERWEPGGEARRRVAGGKEPVVRRRAAG